MSDELSMELIGKFRMRYIEHLRRERKSYEDKLQSYVVKSDYGPLELAAHIDRALAVGAELSAIEDFRDPVVTDVRAEYTEVPATASSSEWNEQSASCDDFRFTADPCYPEEVRGQVYLNGQGVELTLVVPREDQSALIGRVLNELEKSSSFDSDNVVFIPVTETTTRDRYALVKQGGPCSGVLLETHRGATPTEVKDDPTHPLNPCNDWPADRQNPEKQYLLGASVDLFSHVEDYRRAVAALDYKHIPKTLKNYPGVMIVDFFPKITQGRQYFPDHPDLAHLRERSKISHEKRISAQQTLDKFNLSAASGVISAASRGGCLIHPNQSGQIHHGVHVTGVLAGTLRVASKDGDTVPIGFAPGSLVKDFYFSDGHKLKGQPDLMIGIKEVLRERRQGRFARRKWILNASFTFQPPPEERVAKKQKTDLQNTLQRMQSYLLLVAANENKGIDLDVLCSVFPACLGDEPNVLTVAALCKDPRKGGLCDEGAEKSDYGRKKVSIAAPGYGILSTDMTEHNIGHYSFRTGSSQATAIVSAAASLVWRKNPTLEASQVKQRLIATSRLRGFRDTRIIGGVLDINRAFHDQDLDVVLKEAVGEEAGFEPPELVKGKIMLDDDFHKSLTFYPEGDYGSKDDNVPEKESCTLQSLMRIHRQEDDTEKYTIMCLKRGRLEVYRDHYLSPLGVKELPECLREPEGEGKCFFVHEPPANQRKAIEMKYLQEVYFGFPL